jgi:hypothetical protein
MKKSIRFLPAVSGLLLALAIPTVAQAQEPPPPAPVVATSTGFGHSGAGFGVGAAAFLSGLNGIEVVYDQTHWHIEGLFGFSSRETGANMTTTAFQFGGRGWYHLHLGSSSDFSLGGGIGMLQASAGNASQTATVIEPGMLARVFLTPNFALHAMAGMTMAFGDNVVLGPANTIRGFGLTGQFLGGCGFTYFFR